MSHAFMRGLAIAIAMTPLFIACGGNTGAPSAINPTQCSGSSCTNQGSPSSGTTASLCPATADIGSSTYLGGAGSGEIVKLNIDAVNLTYTLTWLESPIPLAPGEVTPTRKGVTLSGTVSHPPTGALPTAEQIRCAFILQPASGTASDGSTYSTASTFNTSNPPMILIGLNGVAGGGIPGAEISYAGATIVGIGTGLFAVTDRKFDFYPFIGFANTDTSIADLQGTYNALLYHIQPSDNYATIGKQDVETFNATGSCTSGSGGTCNTTANAFSLVSSGGYFTSADAPKLSSGTTLGSAAAANMVLGKLNGVLVPIVVRTGVANPGSLTVDDESGIAMLAPDTSLASGGFDGGYAGADSNFKYTATLIQGAAGTFINPSTQASESAFGLSYPNTSPGLVDVTDTSGNTGFAIAAGGLYGVLIQGTENGGITSTSAISGTSSSPYFGIGALVSK
ncbi:DUF2957 domain-containing protein [Paraburkholderia phosphatilytica]|uniref:DUF2957 domain-containing protein n=1 Tax=Paraburkholderia phosphatilytica TaxID=2282883 RepID=UPI000E4F4779|nr:DUF2957 domain-containing protein [Paraburkholderia phosphatilytica]